MDNSGGELCSKPVPLNGEEIELRDDKQGKVTKKRTEQKLLVSDDCLENMCVVVFVSYKH